MGINACAILAFLFLIHQKGFAAIDRCSQQNAVISFSAKLMFRDLKLLTIGRSQLGQPFAVQFCIKCHSSDALQFFTKSCFPNNVLCVVGDQKLGRIYLKSSVSFSA